MPKIIYLHLFLLLNCTSPKEKPVPKEQPLDSRFFYLKTEAYGIKNEEGKVLLHLSESDSVFIEPEKVCSLHLYPNWKKKEFPTEVFNFPNLTFLWVAMRPFKHLPEDIAQLKKLKELDIQNSKLETLPNNIGDLKQLEELTLLFSDVGELPLSICALQNLRKLHLGGTKIKELPACLSNLKKLERFIFFREDEEALSKELIEQLNQLQNQLPNCTFSLE